MNVKKLQGNNFEFRMGFKPSNVVGGKVQKFQVQGTRKDILRELDIVEKEKSSGELQFGTRKNLEDIKKSERDYQKLMNKLKNKLY